MSENPSCDAELSKIFPFRINVRRTKRDFKNLICSLMRRDAVNWINTLAFEDLTGLLENMRGLHGDLTVKA